MLALIGFCCLSAVYLRWDSLSWYRVTWFHVPGAAGAHSLAFLLGKMGCLNPWATRAKKETVPNVLSRGRSGEFS